MPAAWVGAATAVYGAYENSQNSGGGSGGGSGNTSSGRYVPTGTAGVDAGTQYDFNSVGNNASLAQQYGAPAYLQSLNQANGINYNPYQAAANTQGQQYGALAGVAGQQEGMYGQAAQTAQGQQANLYGAGNQLVNQAFDTNNAQYNQTANALSGQVNAGQAARGLGNSPVGGQEYNNAMSNFNTQWNTQQLQNEQIGLQGMSAASNAGGNQGQLMGANLAAQQGAGVSQAGYTGQQAGVPLAAQQYVAGQPAANASSFVNNINGLNNGYVTQGNMGTAYMNQGISAAGANATANTAQNAANTQLLMNSLGPNAGNSSSNPNSWLSNMFSNTGSGSGNEYGTGVNLSGNGGAFSGGGGQDLSYLDGY